MAINLLLREFAQHHRDVDVVLLPEQGQAVDLPIAGPEDLDALAARVDRLVDALLSRLTEHAAWPGDVRREGRWRTRQAATGRAVVRRESVIVAGGVPHGDEVELLRASGNALVALGWQARAVPGTRPRLVGRLDDFTCAAAVHVGSLHVTVTSPLVAADGAVNS